MFRLISPQQPAFKSPPTAYTGPDEGTEFHLPTAKNEVTFCKVSHFGGFLRIAGEVRPPAELRVLVSLALKE